MIRRKQLFVMGLACLALVTSVSQAHHRTHHTVRVRTDEPDLRSSSALVLDSTHSSILYSRKADVSAPIASITKLMTVLVVADAGLPLDEPIQLTTEDRIVGKGASSRLVLFVEPRLVRQRRFTQAHVDERVGQLGFQRGIGTLVGRRGHDLY